MNPPIFDILKANSGVTAILGSSPVRVFPFGEAPQDVVDPYAVWQTISGQPMNYLGDLPDMDQFSVQVDVYGASAQGVRAAAKAIRDALEPVAYITSWRGESRDQETKRYRYSFDVDFHVAR